VAVSRLHVHVIAGIFVQVGGGAFSVILENNIEKLGKREATT